MVINHLLNEMILQALLHVARTSVQRWSCTFLFPWRICSIGLANCYVYILMKSQMANLTVGLFWGIFVVHLWWVFTRQVLTSNDSALGPCCWCSLARGLEKFMDSDVPGSLKAKSGAGASRRRRLDVQFGGDSA